MNNSNKVIARQVKAARTARGWGIRELAKQTGINENTIVQIESGRGNPTLRTLDKLSKVLGLKFAIGGPDLPAETDERIRMALTIIRENADVLERMLGVPLSKQL